MSSLQCVFQLIAIISYIFGPILMNSSPPIWNKAKTSLPTPLAKFVAGLYKNNIYLMGGVIDKLGRTPNLNVYHLNLTRESTSNIIDIDSESLWKEFNEFPSGGLCCFDTVHKGSLTMYSQSSSYSENLLFIVPFVSDHSDKPTVLMIFDMQRQKFRSPSDYKYLLAEQLGDPCIISTSSYVYVIGGVYFTPPNSVEWKNTFQIYDIINDKWTISHPLNIARRGAACNILGSSLYVFGGRGVDGDLNSIEQYHLVKQEGWKMLNDISLRKYDEELRYFCLCIFDTTNTYISCALCLLYHIILAQNCCH